MAEGAMILTVCVLQVPVCLTLDQVGDPAGKGHVGFAQQAAGDRTHARAADPARLLVGGGSQLAMFVVVQMRFPFTGPAFGLPALHFFDETSIAGSEVLRAHVQVARFTAFAGHTATAAPAFIEQVHRVTCCLKGVRC